MAKRLTPAAPTPGSPVVALVGRPNVGKSTLFNVLVGRPQALVSDLPGLTRDRRYGVATLDGLTIQLIDTAGLEERAQGLAQRLNQVTAQSLREANILVLVLDGIAGVLPEDKAIARQLRQTGKTVLTVVNKADHRASRNTILEANQLGWPVVAVSGAHHRGFKELADQLLAFAGPIQPTPTNTVAATSADLTAAGPLEKPAAASPIRLAIVGRPNAGKSTLVNTLLGAERMLTGPEAGLTRESLATPLVWQGRAFSLIDTPGLRRKSKVVSTAEKMSTGTTIGAIDQAQVVLLLLDATCPLEQQDKTIADYVFSQGKPLVVGLNKWDLVKSKATTLKAVQQALEYGLAQVKDIPLVPLTATQGQGVNQLHGPIVTLWQKWQTEIGTGELNRWLAAALERRPPPRQSGRAVKIKYLTQTATCPPTFQLFCNLPEAVPTDYLRYLSNQLRQAYQLDGIVLRWQLKGGGSNPYGVGGSRRGDPTNGRPPARGARARKT